MIEVDFKRRLSVSEGVYPVNQSVQGTLRISAKGDMREERDDISTELIADFLKFFLSRLVEMSKNVID
jgi:hypothetical protein